MKIIYTAILFVTYTFFTCGNVPYSVPKNKFDQLKKAEWLIGTWRHTSLEGTLQESWEVKNDSVYAGTTHFIIGKDTVFTENITLEQLGSDLYYITQVSNQNEGKPVSFKMTNSSKSKLVFENALHDFPQKITYTSKGDSLIAEISGTQKGASRSERFAMGKMK
jgi:hypothetical protein